MEVQGVGLVLGCLGVVGGGHRCCWAILGGVGALFGDLG